MPLPSFDLGEAINQVISGAVTLASVLVGARIAFTQGVRHLRHERALDRRLQSLETILGLVEEYRTIGSVFVSAYETPVQSETSATRDHILKEMTAVGRRLSSALSQSKLYGNEDEQMQARQLFVTQLGVYVHSWGLAGESEKKPEHLVELKKAIEALDEAHKLHVDSLRRELAIANERDAKGWLPSIPKR